MIGAEERPGQLSDSLQPLATKQINLDVLSGRAEPGVTVTDAEVRAAQRFAFSKMKLVVEPGGAAALAAALAGKIALDQDTVIMNLRFETSNAIGSLASRCISIRA